MGNKLTRRNFSSPAKFIRRGGRAVVSAALPLSAPCRAVALAKADQPSTISYTRLISAKQRVNVGNERVSKLSKVRSSEFGLKYECCFLAHHKRSVFPNARFELVNFDVAPHDGPSRQMKPSQAISKATPRLTFTVACCGAWRLSPNAIRIYAQYVPARAASYTRRLDQAYGEARGARGAPQYAEAQIRMAMGPLRGKLRSSPARSRVCQLLRRGCRPGCPTRRGQHRSFVYRR